MTSPHTIKRHRGHTLVELMAAMVSGSILLAGLGSVMMIARQIAYTPTAAAKQLDASQVADTIANELRYATFIVTHTSNVIEFVVADRDGDGAAERFRYEWSGVAGAPLQKTVNGGTAFDVLASVQNFQCSWQTESQATDLTTTADTSEAILVSNASSPSSSDRDINALAHAAQRLNPTTFTTAAPAGAICWNITKVDFYGRNNSSATETLRVQIRNAGDPSDYPTSNLLGEVAVPEANLTGSRGWNTVTFSSPIRGLALNRNYDLVWTGTTGEAGDAAKLVIDSTASTGVNESTDGGLTWRFWPLEQTYYKLYGTYTKPGTTYTVTRNYATHVALVLQTGSTTQSRINASVPLVNAPELLTAYWRADFDANPTTTDITRDGTSDWVVPSGTFNTATMSGGIWQPASVLESRPLNNFTNITTVEARCRNTSVGGNGAVVQINADRQGGLYAPLFVRVQRQSDGTQTLTLFGKSDASTNVTLFKRSNLPSSLIRFRLTILPQNNVVNLRLNDEDQGTFTYNTFAPSANDGFTTMYTDTSTSEFDYVEVRVGEN